MGWNPFRRVAAPAPVRKDPTLSLIRGRVGGGGLREFQAGTVDLLTSDFPLLTKSGNAALRPALRVMRSRSRQLSENNDYMREFLRTVVKKTLGPKGIGHIVRAMRPDGKTVDQTDSDYLADAFTAWGKEGVCTVCGRYSWADVQRLVLTSVVRDGEILVRLVRGFPNKWGFALQLLECDVLDESLNVARGAGYGGIPKPPQNEIRMGVERDPWGKVAAYHVLTRHPGDDLGYVAPYTQYERLDAADTLHIFLPDRVDDARGAPWAWTAIRRLLMAGGYEEAELVAARLGASKGGFFEEEVDGEVTGDAEDAAGNIIQDVQPGEFTRLPKGVKFTAYDPQHPNSGFGNFLKSVLRGACAGLGVSYNGIAKDLEGVNYSSLRQGELDDRDFWKLIQDFMARKLCEPVKESWLDMGLLKPGALNLPPSKRDKFAAFEWRPRGWPWVDPQKDITADAQAINLGVKSRSQVCAERGVDFEDVLRELKHEIELAEQYNVPLGTGDPKLAPPAPADDPLAASSEVNP